MLCALLPTGNKLVPSTVLRKRSSRNCHALQLLLRWFYCKSSWHRESSQATAEATALYESSARLSKVTGSRIRVLGIEGDCRCNDCSVHTQYLCFFWYKTTPTSNGLAAQVHPCLTQWLLKTGDIDRATQQDELFHANQISGDTRAPHLNEIHVQRCQACGMADTELKRARRGLFVERLCRFGDGCHHRL